eukprot:SAG22_NODE_405_length_11004_cov_4.629986_7_plen_721_part_00
MPAALSFFLLAVSLLQQETAGSSTSLYTPAERTSTVTDTPGPGGAGPALPWRGWTLLNAVGGPEARNWSATAAFVRGTVLPAARLHNITHLQLSQQLSWNAEDFDDPAARAAVAEIARDCRAAGLHSSIWTHELSRCPAPSLRGGKCVLDDRLFGWLAAKYKTLWSRLPEVGGVVLTISETAFDVTCEAGCKVVSNQTVPQRLVRLIRTVMAASPGKTVIMRAFVHTHANLDLMLAALHALADMPAVQGGAELVVMAKAPPCDWHPFFPFNPLWNQWTGNAQPLLAKGIKLIMEVDAGLEMLGQNQFVAPLVESVGAMISQARLFGAAGVSARIERSCLSSEVSTTGSCRKLASGQIQPNTQTLGSANEVVLTALTSWLLDPNSTVASVWQQWGKRQGYSADQAAHLERILGPVAGAVARAYFPLEQWTTQHSNIALSKIINTDLTSYVVTNSWVPSPANAIANRKLLHPRPVDIQGLLDDQAIPANVLKRSLRVLAGAEASGALPAMPQKAGPGPAPSSPSVAGLREKLIFTATGVAVLRAVHLTAFGTQALLGLKAAADNNVTGVSVPGDAAWLHAVVHDAMATLHNASAARHAWPIDTLNLQNFLADAQHRLAALIPPVVPAGYSYAGEGACRDASGRYGQYGELKTTSGGAFTSSECAANCTSSSACEAFMIGDGSGCQFFCSGGKCALCPHSGDGGGRPTKGDGTAGQHCFVKKT